MADNFTYAVDRVLEFEGFLSDDPHDAGGLTKYGISKAAHPTVDIANLTLDQATEIYRTEYWQAAGCEAMPWHWAFAIFDCAVNQGVGAAKSLAQQALGVSVDGVIGPHTIAAMGRPDSLDRLDDFFARRGMRYADNPEFERFGHGWLKRLFAVHEIAL